MKHTIILLLLLGLNFRLLAQQADAINGTWQLPDHKAQIRISQHGNVFAGKLSNATVNVGGSLKLGLPTAWLGIYILQDIKFVRDNRWEGIIVNPQDGKKYSCKLQLKNNSTLKVRGYKGVPLLGKTMYLEKIE